jgi:hypothetical protein
VVDIQNHYHSAQFQQPLHGVLLCLDVSQFTLLVVVVMAAALVEVGEDIP